MKRLLTTFILLLTFFLAFVINPDEEEVAETDSESEVSTEESEDESAESDTEEQTKDSEETEPVAEAEAEETKESTPPPTAPWKRLPVTTKIPVNYDIDLPQDI
ncbi:MAG: hypothetical protein F4W92_00480 [Gammaproteobacteria bacterium]|nr:hypothetical protein [Gammaproteobacteria bacterium]